MKLIDWIDGISHTAYMITPEGEIWSTESEQYLKKQDNKGYHEVDLKWEGIRKKAKVHRLVAQAFYGPPPFPKAEVDHLDMDRHNNHKDNLEWVTKSTNIQRRNESGSDPGGKAKIPLAIIPQDPDDGIYIAESHTDARKYLMCTPAELRNAISTDHEINGTLVYPIQNPEVLQNERNKNRKKQGHSERTGSASPEGLDTERSPIAPDPPRRQGAGEDQEGSESGGSSSRATEALGRSAREQSEKIALSSLAQETLDKWKVKAKS